MYDFPKPFSYASLDAIVARVEKEVPDEAGTVYVARWVRDQIVQAMNDSHTVFYQP